MIRKNLLSKAIHTIDAWLWRHGFRLEKVRILIRTLLLLNIVLLFLGIISIPLNLQLFSFALASLISSLSFFSMAKNIIFKFPLGGASKVTFISLLNWCVRLVLVLALSLVALILFELPAIAWFAGLGTPILMLPLALFQQKDR